jgi:hypothetical protein
MNDQPVVARRIDRSAFAETLEAWLKWLDGENARSRERGQ